MDPAGQSSHRGLVAVLLAIVLLSPLGFLVANGAAQEAKPNFSGTWKLNLSRSKCDGCFMGGWDCGACLLTGELLEIEHSNSRLTMRHPFDRAGGQTYFYVIDGKERVSLFSSGGISAAKAHWDGDILVIEKRQQNNDLSYQRGDTSGTSQYSLFDGGKTLCIAHQTGPWGVHSQLIYDKQ